MRFFCKTSYITANKKDGEINTIAFHWRHGHGTDPCNPTFQLEHAALCDLKNRPPHKANVPSRKKPSYHLITIKFVILRQSYKIFQKMVLNLLKRYFIGQYFRHYVAGITFNTPHYHNHALTSCEKKPKPNVFSISVCYNFLIKKDPFKRNPIPCNSLSCFYSQKDIRRFPVCSFKFYSLLSVAD